MNKKTVFIVLGVLGGVAALGAAVVALVFYATSGVTDAADKFFTTARGGDMAQVYALTSAELRNTTTREQLAAYVQENRFDQVAETSWSSRSIKNNLGSVEGSLTLDDGGVIPISMQLVKEADDWKISFIELRNAGLSGGAAPETGPQTAAAGPGLPPANVILNLARAGADRLLGAALSDAGPLGLGSELEFFQAFWVEGTTVEQLRALVTPMRSETAAAEALRDARPVIERVSPVAGGGFRAEGHLEAASWRLTFAQTYLPDGERWKMAAFDYELTDAR